jgi:hypothetical protein
MAVVCAAKALPNSTPKISAHSVRRPAVLALLPISNSQYFEKLSTEKEKKAYPPERGW